jgi:hypothetical protein
VEHVPYRQLLAPDLGRDGLPGLQSVLDRDGQRDALGRQHLAHLLGHALGEPSSIRRALVVRLLEGLQIGHLAPPAVV